MSEDSQSPRQPRARPQLRRFLRTLTAVVTIYLLLAAMRAPSSTTTWMDAWFEAATAGCLAGLGAVWFNRSRGGEPSPVWKFVTGLALVGIAAGFLESVTRPRRSGRS